MTAPETPEIPTLEEVKRILGDRVQDWPEGQIIGALAYVDLLAEREPPTPRGGHGAGCRWAWTRTKGSLCTCDPERPR